MIPMSRPSVPVDLEVCWTQSAETAEVKSQQLPAPPLWASSGQPIKTQILNAMRSGTPGRRWDQQQLAQAVRRRRTDLNTALKELVRAGRILEVETGACTREGPRLVYTLVGDGR